MTEDEAKTKLCCGPPIAAAAVLSQQSNSTIGLNAGRCIASACMAWRRQTVMIDRATGEAAVPGQTAIGQLEERYSAHGFCGLAGARA